MGRPRDRKSAEGLLPRMEARPLKNGGFSYRYKPVDGKPIPLGRDKLAACRQVLDLLGQTPHFGTLKWVWEKFTDPEKPAARWKRLAEVTKEDYRAAWKQLDKTFGRMKAAHITSTMFARYVHVERADTPKRANTEKALASNLFGHGILLGVCSINPTIGVEPHQLEPRTEAPKTEILGRFLVWLAKQTPQQRLVGMAAEYCSLAGNRKVEFLPLTWPQVDRAAGVVRTFRAKQRGKKKDRIVEVVEISPALGSLLDRLESIRTDRECLVVFPTRDGNAYTARGFKSIWQRIVLDAIKDKVLTAETRFTFNDLRAYYTTEHKAKRKRLPDLHNNPQTTAQVYDRNVEVPRKAN